MFNTCSTDHGSGRQPYTGRADVIAVHVSQNEDIFVIPVGECPSFQGMLRLTPPQNNQRRGIRFAADYTLDNWIESLASGVVNRLPRAS